MNSAGTLTSLSPRHRSIADSACVTCAGSAELNKFLSIPAELQAAVGAAKPIKEGMLSKQGHLRKNWQSR